MVRKVKKKRKILTVIPARGGSKGIKRKNIQMLNGHPLVSYSIKAAKSASKVEKVIVSTDDTEIAEIANSYGAETPFIRPKKYATDTTTLILVMRHALAYFDSIGEKFDAVLSLQPTNPLIKPANIDEAIDKFHATDCQAVASIAKVGHGHPYVCKRLVGDRIENFVTPPKDAILFPRQKREPAYYFNGAMYLRDRVLIENFNGRDWGLGSDPRVVEMDHFESIDIDEMIDLKVADVIIREQNNE